MEKLKKMWLTFQKHILYLLYENFTFYNAYSSMINLYCSNSNTSYVNLKKIFWEVEILRFIIRTSIVASNRCCVRLIYILREFQNFQFQFKWHIWFWEFLRYLLRKQLHIQRNSCLHQNVFIRRTDIWKNKVASLL